MQTLVGSKNHDCEASCPPSIVAILVDVSTCAIIPTSLAKIDVQIIVEDQKIESLFSNRKMEAQVGGILNVTDADCDAKHAKVTSLFHTTVKVGRSSHFDWRCNL